MEGYPYTWWWKKWADREVEKRLDRTMAMGGWLCWNTKCVCVN